MFNQITSFLEHHFKSFNRIKSTQDEKVRFIKGNEFNLTPVELLSFFFKSAELNTKKNFYNIIIHEPASFRQLCSL